MLTFLNRGSEDIPVLAIVITELKLCHVQRHVFFANLVESADDAALEDGPKAFDGLGVDGANNILAGGVVDDGMRVFYHKHLPPPGIF